MKDLLMPTPSACEHLFEASERKGSFGKVDLFKEVHFLEILENLEIHEILQSVEKQRESHYVLEMPEICPVKRSLS